MADKLAEIGVIKKNVIVWIIPVMCLYFPWFCVCIMLIILLCMILRFDTNFVPFKGTKLLCCAVACHRKHHSGHWMLHWFYIYLNVYTTSDSIQLSIYLERQYCVVPPYTAVCIMLAEYFLNWLHIYYLAVLWLRPRFFRTACDRI